MSKVENEVPTDEKEVSSSIEDVRQANAEARTDQAQNTSESVHDSLIRQASQENQEKILKEIRKHITKQLIDRKVLVRQMEQLDLACSTIDAKLEALTSMFEQGQFITEDEVRAFMNEGEYVAVFTLPSTDELIDGFLKKQGDIHLGSFAAGDRLQPVKRKTHPRM